MRSVTMAAGILVLSLGAYSAVTMVAQRAVAAEPQDIRGPMPAHGAPVPTSTSSQPQSQKQQIPSAQQQLKVQTNLVNVFVTVRDKHHNIVSNAGKDEFKVYEDGVEQKIAYFSKDMNLPITLGLLVDTSGSQDRLLSAEQETASRFLKEVMRPKDLAMVMSFDTDANLLADFTEDTGVLNRAIQRTQINAPAVGAGGTAGTIPDPDPKGTVLYDAVYLACHDELSSEAGRKAIILLTDAEDQGSKLSLNDAIESAQRADTVIHVLLLADPGGYFGFGMGYTGGAVAQRMAEATGGRVINVHNEKSLEKAFDEISEELRSQYVIGYYPSNTKHDGTFRKIEVKVNRPDTKALARRGYYAPAR